MQLKVCFRENDIVVCFRRKYTKMSLMGQICIPYYTFICLMGINVYIIYILQVLLVFSL